MGRSRYPICHEQAPHFLTCTVLNRMLLFIRPETVGIINALHGRQDPLNWKIYGNVILENHPSYDGGMLIPRDYAGADVIRGAARLTYIPTQRVGTRK